MLTDYKLSRCSRRCARLDRPLRPGEVFFTVVQEQEDQLVRTDISEEAWSGPPEGALAHWRNRMPQSEHRKLQLAPPPVLIDLLHQWSEEPTRQSHRYLLALLLLRRRLARPLASDPENARETLRLEVGPEGIEVSVACCDIAPVEARRLQAELTELLYCEAE